MDIVTHAVNGFLMFAFIPEIGIPLGIANGIASTIPDLVGEYKAKYQDDNYVWYADVHNWKKKYLNWIPGIAFHIFLDKFGHTIGKRWYVLRERGWIEILNWIINIGLVWLLIMKF